MKTLIFFGGTGNSFVNKIFPALFAMYAKADLQNVQIITPGRRFAKQDEYQRFLLQSLREKELPISSGDSLRGLWKKFHYIRGDIEDNLTFIKLNQYSLFFYPDHTLTAESLFTERRAENAIS